MPKTCCEVVLANVTVVSRPSPEGALFAQGWHDVASCDLSISMEWHELAVIFLQIFSAT